MPNYFHVSVLLIFFNLLYNNRQNAKGYDIVPRVGIPSLYVFGFFIAYLFKQIIYENRINLKKNVQ